MRITRGTKIISALCLSLIVGGALWGLSPVTRLSAVEEESGQLLWCAAAMPGEPLVVRYLSRNSIYGVTAEETWEVDSKGISIVRVRSAPIVLDYYGMSDYRILPNGLAEGVPSVTRYPRLRLKVSPRGEEKLIYGADELDLSATVPEGTVVLLQPSAVSRFQPCP